MMSGSSALYIGSQLLCIDSAPGCVSAIDTGVGSVGGYYCDASIEKHSSSGDMNGLGPVPLLPNVACFACILDAAAAISIVPDGCVVE